MVAQISKILSKLTVRVSGKVTLSDTKQGFTVSQGKQRCMKDGLCNICKFCNRLLYLCLLLIYFLQLDVIFFHRIAFEKVSLRNR